MKAIIQTEYGAPDVLNMAEIDKPTSGDKEILVKVRSTSVGYGDIMARNFGNITIKDFNMPYLFFLFTKLEFGSRKPKKKILGSEFSGIVESTGKDVTKFKEGDEVFGYRAAKFGANAEYLCVPEKSNLALKPSNMSFEEAGTITYGSLTALNILSKMKIRKGRKVLVIGASGSIGSAAVQLAANHYGAEVTGVCSTAGIDYVKALGAKKVIDYSNESYTESGETYDLIFDVLGKSSFSEAKGSLSRKGVYLRASFKSRHLWQMIRTKIAGGKKVICSLSMERPGDLAIVRELIEEGKIKSIIAKTFTLEQLPEAHRFIESGGIQGKVAVKIHENLINN